MSLIAMTHPDHGTHVVYSDQEKKACAENGWQHDKKLSKELAGETALDDEVKRKPGRPPKDD